MYLCANIHWLSWSGCWPIMKTIFLIHAISIYSITKKVLVFLLNKICEVAHLKISYDFWIFCSVTKFCETDKAFDKHNILFLTLLIRSVCLLLASSLKFLASFSDISCNEKYSGTDFHQNENEIFIKIALKRVSLTPCVCVFIYSIYFIYSFCTDTWLIPQEIVKKHKDT